MIEAAPFHLESRLRNALARVQELARARGQARAFDLELFSLQLTVQEALESRSRGLVEHAIEEVRLFRERLLDAFPRTSDAAVGPKIGR
jgi:hypothetical protein